MAILKAEEIEKTYDDNGVPVTALDDVSVSIERGEFLAIAGPSGSGKTTLLNLLGALDSPTTGTVMLEDQVLLLTNRSKMADLRLRKIGFIFQAYNLIPVLTALENIEFKLMLLGVPDRERRERSLAIMKELGIETLADKRPNEMSGGQQQRVAVARAIVNNPPIVLADEPTANLDSVTAHHLIDLMVRMNREKGITFVFSSHDSQVLEHARRVIHLRDGKVERDIVK
jgi:putative ABC transport system ATP-binding protein